MSPDLSPRKQPQQRRSREMQARILDASVRVLSAQGALAFTTTRVAEEAGVSVGSLYQYFPNKHALVAALHERDVRDGADHVQAILDRPGGSPREKLHEIVEWFFTTEAEEAAALGTAMGDVDAFLRHGAADVADHALIADTVRRFAEFIEAGSIGERTETERANAARFAMTAIESIGKSLAARQPRPEIVRVWARDTANMLADHLTFE